MRKRFILRALRKQFNCQQCQACCRQDGFVFLKEKDIRGLTDFFRQTREKVLKEYCVIEEGGHVLKKNPDESCVFLSSSGCQIHEHKPIQCKQFPVAWHDGDCYDYCLGIQQIKQQIKERIQT